MNPVQPAMIIPGYRIIGMQEINDSRVLLVSNIVSAKRFAIEPCRLSALAHVQPAHRGKQLAEDLALLSAGMPVSGISAID